MNTDNKQFPIKREDYESMLQHAVAVIEHARLEIAKHINGNIASAYWEIGKMLHERKVESGHGDGVVRQLSVDLKERYPKMGLSPRNIWYMKRFYSSPLSRSTLIDCRNGAVGWVRQDVHSVLLSYWSTRLAGTPSSWYMLRAISKLRLRRPCKMSLNVVGDTPMAAAANCGFLWRLLTC